MAKHSKRDTIAAWLQTIAADSQGNPERPGTMLPGPDSKVPLLTSFQSLRDTSSAAPLEMGATIAEGGMGVIKVADQLALGRSVVVKTLRSDYAAQAAEHVLREAWATGALEHPNIVPVHDIRTDDDGSPMIVLKRIEGETWTALMHRPDLLAEKFGVQDSLDWNTEILRQVTQAVRFSHSRGILHRDLKPDNVMIGAFGEVYLVDWGIAMSLSPEGNSPLPPASGADEMAGTPCYMAPEMLGDAPLDERTDVYLLGAVLFEVLAARPPHRLSSLEDLLDDIRTSQPIFPEDACPLLSALCAKAMSADPEERFASASDFATALAESRLHRESADMAELAHEQLIALEQDLDQKDASRHEIYGLFGALRLGFREALKIWPGNKAAKEHLDRATTALINYEIQERNPHAALTLVSEISAPDADLQKRIDDAIKRKAQEESELREFRTDSDETIGQRTRVFLIVVLGLLWTASPLLRYTFRGTENLMSYNELILGTFAFMAINTVLLVWARESLSRTTLNRNLSRAMFVVFPLQVVMLFGARFLGLPVEYTGPLMIFLWLSVSSIGALIIDLRFWPTVLGYAAAFLVSCYSIDLRYVAMAAGNFTLMCSCIYIWYPKKGVYERGMMGKRVKEAAEP